MNKPQYQKLAAHYDKVKRIRKRIESIERVIRSMQREINDGGEMFDVWITRKGRYGHNISGEFTANTFKKTILPLLRENLTELRKEFKAIPLIFLK
ncbi:hypothetical protein LCGC14_1968180 [marine sediment metagenome]|uniref:Uncharacterized protein n=1 Tax=marine sediment metagenome TaxID=412755 RepID=A0A0F9I9H6_9ZZZZ